MIVNTAYMDSGTSCEVIYEHCFLKLKPSIRSLQIDSKTSLVGFSEEHSWPLGEVPLEITIGDSPYIRTEILNFVIVRSNSPYNLLLRRIAIQRMGIVVSTIHGAIKFYTPKGFGHLIFDTANTSKEHYPRDTTRLMWNACRATTLLSLEWSSGFLPVSPSSLVVPTSVASPVTTPVATIEVDKDEFLEVGAHLELHKSILYDHTQCLDVLPPTLFEGYDRDLRELYTRSGAVRDEIFSQRYRLRSLEREQERAIVTFSAIWRRVLALESWAGYVDTQRAEMWYARYDDHRLIHYFLVQHTAMQRELQEMRGRVATLEQERSRKLWMVSLEEGPLASRGILSGLNWAKSLGTAGGEKALRECWWCRAGDG
ncbi:hypothetical protein Tco_1361793 [Tanacetum coccineum]